MAHKFMVDIHVGLIFMDIWLRMNEFSGANIGKWSSINKKLDAWKVKSQVIEKVKIWPSVTTVIRYAHVYELDLDRLYKLYFTSLFFTYICVSYWRNAINIWLIWDGVYD